VISIEFILDTLVLTVLFAIVTLSLNLKYGYTGLLDFGKAAFFATGAYVSGLMTTNSYPPILGILTAIVIAALMGLLISIPAIRVRSDYLAIITLVFSETIRIILKNESWIAGGVLGIRGIPPLIDPRTTPYQMYLLTHLLIALMLYMVFFTVSWLLTNSPFGRILKAIREDEIASAMYGKNNTLAKAFVFSFSCAMAASAGSLYAHYVGFVSPDLFVLAITLQVWIMSIIGGPSTISGSFIGALTVLTIARGTRIIKDYLNLPIDPNNTMFILTGILLIITIMFRPTGLVKEGKIKVV
jgi:branched-chain amino acid transport system permease protein